MSYSVDSKTENEYPEPWGLYTCMAPLEIEAKVML